MREHWDRAEKLVAEYLESADGALKIRPDGDAKALYESWRVFSLAVACLKRIQEARVQFELEVQREERCKREEENGAAAEEFTRRIESLLEQMREEGEDEDPEGPMPT